MPFSAIKALCAVLCGYVAATTWANAEDGVGADRILFGQAAVLEGQTAALGRGMKAGLDAAFTEVNRAGASNARRLELKSIDDGYEPNKSVAAVKTLLHEDRVFALVGAVGTPTAAAIQPIASAAGVPFIGAFTGAEFLREPYQPLIVNVRASYFQETEAMVAHLTNDLGVAKIAVMYQDDAFGQAGLAGVKRALDKRNMQLLGEGTFLRNTIAVKGALLAVRKAQPDAVIMIAPYKPAAEFIKLARQIKFNPIFVNISFVGSDALAEELGPAGAGVVVTQVVPFPQETAIPVVARYQAALKSSDPAAVPGFVSLEGYLVGRTIAAALARMGGEPSRRGFINAISMGGPIELDGFRLVYGPNNNHGSDQVFLTVIEPDGRFKPVTRLTKPPS
ncbi:MAG: hypothetical protein QOF91_3645 [Alphaproteobacteria bacterium]|jgi:ABC-type branched-subunit amino acid transport system substrate-binding protein|nr:hypothetical protein [Alphaproteobacteria bacterium]